LLRYIGHGVRWGGGLSEEVELTLEDMEDIKKRAQASFCKRQILERLKNRDRLRAAREKRLKRARSRSKLQRKFIGTVIDAPDYEETIRFIPANQN
jgi:hypothetical protein